MKKLIMKTLFLALAVCMLCSLSVLASESESNSVSLAIATEEAQLVTLNKSNSTLGLGTTLLAGSMDAGVIGNIQTYKITDVSGKVTSLESVSRLYLRFDISKCKNWDITEAKFSMNVKNTNSNTSTISIYDASDLEGKLSDIPTTYKDKVNALTDIATENRRKDSFTVRGKTGADYITSPGLRITRDFKDFIAGAVSRGEDYVTLLIEFKAGGSDPAYVAYIGAAGTSYPPELKITGVPRTGFYLAEKETLSAANPIVYNYTNQTQIEVTNNMTVQNNSTEGYHKIFVTYDLTGVDKTKIEKATFKQEGYRNAGAQSLKITEVVTPFNTEDKSFELGDTSAESEAFEWKTWQIVTADLTDMIKNCSGNSLTVCIESKNGDGTLRLAVTSNNYQRPVIELDLGAEKVSEFSTLTAGDAITAERYVIKGSAEAPISAVPIIALFNEAEELVDVVIGENVTLDGTGQVVSVSVTATEDIASPNASFFLWTSLSELVPVIESSSID